MPVIDADTLTRFVAEIFAHSGASREVAQTVAESLVLSNLKGHDSHGVIRVIEYVDWIAKGWIVPSAALEVVTERESLLVVDGHFGFGQVIGREATKLAIPKAKRTGVCVLAIRRSAHLGRLGEFMEMAAEAGLVGFSFTNTHGGGVLVAPHGGSERRLSANPLAAAAPLPDGTAMVMDMATSMVAEGKLKVARAKGERVPPGCMVNSDGEPSTDPEEYYGDPPGALLPFGGHKGFALSMFAEVFAGALSGAGCSKQGVDRIANAMLGLFLDPAAFGGEGFFQQEVGDLVRHEKSSRPMQGFAEVLVPGEPELRELERRTRAGIPLEEATWSRIVQIAAAREVAAPAAR
jgi:uncharacterized oxidoreductase